MHGREVYRVVAGWACGALLRDLDRSVFELVQAPYGVLAWQVADRFNDNQEVYEDIRTQTREHVDEQT